MKKLLPILVLLGACAPDIAQEPAPSTDVVIVEFDPAAAIPIAPSPNDLALRTGLIVVPDVPSEPRGLAHPEYSPAQKELNDTYLAKLNGFPYESSASVTLSGNLKPDTVKASTILAFDVTDPASPKAVVIAPTYADKIIITPASVDASGVAVPEVYIPAKITIPPPEGNWQRAHRYAIAAIGGANGLRGAGGQDVIGSQVWTLVSSRNPLVTCPDLKTNCQPAIDVIPSTETDPDKKLADQTASAIQLEQLRRGYAPILDALGGPPLDVQRKDIPIVWTFSIVDAGEMTFDLSKPVKTIPFPNDLARTGPKGTVSLPNPKTGAPLTFDDCVAPTDTSIQLFCGLNTLDGFSMLAPLVSENSDTAGALDQGLIDDKSLNPMSVGLVKLASKAPMAIQTTPKWTPCLNCTSSPKADGTPQTSPQQLQWKLDVPLDEQTTYFGYVSSGVKDTTGKPVIANPQWALLRSSAPLVDAAGKSTVSLISDDQAKQFEPLRVAFMPALDGLEKAGIHRADLALGFPFTTQSASTILDTLYKVPTSAKALGLPDFPVALQKASVPYFAAMDAAGASHAAIADIYAGAWYTPVAVTGPSGTLNPDPTKIKILPVQFAISIPAGVAPAGGWPVTIFGHGLQGDRNQFLNVANALASVGQAVISADTIWHGERSSCTGVKTVIAQPDDAAACKDPATMKCDEGFQGLCVLRDDAARATCVKNITTDPYGDGFCTAMGQGRCAADNKCQGAGATLAVDATNTPLISGWNFLPLPNFFGARDNMRQQVIDLSQLVNVLKSADPKKIGNQITLANAGVPVSLDPTKINYLGHSLGSILGTLFASVSPDVNNVMLNVGGGVLTTLLDSPYFATAKKGLIDNLGAGGIQPGTPAFDFFLVIAQWVLDESDPAVMAYRLTHGVDIGGGVTAPSANRKVFIQFIEGDQTVTNVTNLGLVVGANRDFVPTPPGFGCKPPLFCYEFTEKGDGFDTTTAPLDKRHGFLRFPPSATAGGLALTTKAQTQAATFLATGALP